MNRASADGQRQQPTRRRLLHTVATAALLAGVLLAANSARAERGATAPVSACHTDAQAHCPGLRPGGGQLLACLEKHQAQLSSSCQAAMPAWQACRQAVQARCPEAVASGPQRACLARLRQDLPAACRGIAARI